jgi:signal transduction histidine kinase
MTQENGPEDFGQESLQLLREANEALVLAGLRAQDEVASLGLNLLRVQQQARAALDELDRANAEVQRLSRVLLIAREEERRLIARDLHDDLAQRLIALGMRLAALRGGAPGAVSSADAMIELEQQVQSLSGAVRRLAHELHPSILEDLGLEVALRRLVEDFQATWTGAVVFEAQGSCRDIAAPVATAFYRITQEALHNIAKYAVPGPVVVRLQTGSGKVCLTVEDSGPGFDYQAVRRNRQGLGLTSIEERAQLVGGTFQVTSGLTGGTTLTVVVALPKNEANDG